jgi:prepilin-type N-terminal cleavage/methylation domain-containing protein
MKRRSDRPSFARGLTFVEMMIALMVLGVLVLPTARYLATMLKLLLRGDVRAQGQEQIRVALVDIDRDFKDMTEVSHGGGSRTEGNGTPLDPFRREIRFYMGDQRHPRYAPLSNSLNNRPCRFDSDIDGDALGFLPAGGARLPNDLRLMAISTAGWRSGFNLDDDDDMNPNGIGGDGQRDVECRYRWYVSSQTLVRDFRYDGGPWTDRKVVLTNVVGATISYTGAAGQDDAPPRHLFDRDNDGVVRQLELDCLGRNDLGVIGAPGACAGASDAALLTSFLQRRYISSVRLRLTVKPHRKNSVLVSIDEEFRPPALEAKRKYPQ